MSVHTKMLLVHKRSFRTILLSENEWNINQVNNNDKKNYRNTENSVDI